MVKRSHYKTFKIMGEIRVKDYRTVAELVKFAQNNKRRIEVKKIGDNFSGYYWKVKIHETR